MDFPATQSAVVVIDLLKVFFSIRVRKFNLRVFFPGRGHICRDDQNAVQLSQKDFLVDLLVDPHSFSLSTQYARDSTG